MLLARWISAGIAILGFACRTEVPLDRQYADARALLRAQRYDQASREADDGLRRSARSADLKTLWQFRLLRVEVLLGRRLAEQALKALDEYGDPPAGPEWDEVRGRALLLRGQAFYTLSRLAAAHTFLAAAASAAHSPELQAEVELREGTLDAIEGHFGEAHAELQAALDASMKLGDRYLEALTSSNIGFALHAESRYEEAISWYERSRALSLGLGAGDSAARADGNLGACYASLGDYENAQLHYDSAQAAFARSGDRFDQQIFLGNSGNVLRSAGDYSAAESVDEKALAIARALPSPVWESRWLNNLALDAISLERWDAAAKYNDEALALKRKLGETRFEPSSLENAADIAAGQGKFDEAADLYRQVLRADAEDPRLFVDAHAGLAENFARAGRLRDAEEEFRATIAEIEKRGSNLSRDESRLAWLASLNQFYRGYVDFLVANGQTMRALEVAESSRSHVLAGLPERKVADYRRVARDSGATLLEYWLGKKQSYLWAVRANGVAFHTLPARSALHPLIENYSAVVEGGRNPLDVADETGEKLYDTLLAPAVADAAGGRGFIIVPDDDLYSFNFETLPAGRDIAKFWIEDATVSIAHSLNFLAGGATRSGRSSGLLLLGDAVPSMEQFPRLEFASQEMDSIVSEMKGSRAVVLKGSDARPEAYAAADPGHFGFIHFSAHASANRMNPLDSAIILSGPADRCRLTARDVAARPLNARLVTVSACRSAGGRAYAGEGLVGFAWAFLKAGAQNVIAGLWDVNDRSTMQLMSRLYGEIGAGAPIPDALRTARLALIHEGGAYAKPFYWAPFQLYTGNAVQAR